MEDYKNPPKATTTTTTLPSPPTNRVIIMRMLFVHWPIVITHGSADKHKSKSVAHNYRAYSFEFGAETDENTTHRRV